MTAGVEWVVDDVSTWSWTHIGAFTAVIILGFEFVAHLVPLVFFKAPRIVAKGSHHDALDRKDMAFIAFNRLVTVPFVFLSLRFLWRSPSVQWQLHDVTLLNTVAAYVALHVVYDLFYTLFHTALHVRWLYPLIHKHHHRQHAPSRGNLDAINVHPVEFVIGEALHLVSAYIITMAFGMQLHVVTYVMFLFLGAVFASLNHTRFDVRIPPSVYDVR